MWTLAPVLSRLGRLLPGGVPSIEAQAVRSWELAPGLTRVSPPALFLPGQLERVTGWTFSEEHPERAMRGGLRSEHAATRAFLLRGAWLVDGTLYAGRAPQILRPRRHPLLALRVQDEIMKGSLFATFGGMRYFGQWLMDDCVTYPLARDAAEAVDPIRADWPHAPFYASRLGICPRQVDTAYFHELVVFQDVGQNLSKRKRFRAQVERLGESLGGAPHPGVFLLRGTSGDRRIMVNELELAEYLRVRRGFRVVDVATADATTLAAACAGARVVVGVEGSQLIHGILALREGGTVLALQPPHRFVSVYKDLTDRDDQRFAFVVGSPCGADFRVDSAEVERTLDLVGSNSVAQAVATA